VDHPRSDCGEVGAAAALAAPNTSATMTTASQRTT
jgi:hypothetical protein